MPFSNMTLVTVHTHVRNDVILMSFKTEQKQFWHRMDFQMLMCS